MYQCHPPHLFLSLRIGGWKPSIEILPLSIVSSRWVSLIVIMSHLDISAVIISKFGKRLQTSLCTMLSSLEKQLPYITFFQRHVSSGIQSLERIIMGWNFNELKFKTFCIKLLIYIPLFVIQLLYISSSHFVFQTLIQKHFFT